MGRVIGPHISRASSSAKVGVRINSIGDEALGRSGSLANSFTPSATG